VKWLFLIGVLSMVGLAIVQRLPANVSHRVPMLVLQSYIPGGGYKSSAQPVLVLRLPDGGVIDKQVSWATFYLYPKGSTITFMESPASLGRASILVSIILPVLLMVVGIVGIVLPMGRFIFSRVQL
jgi:hypothetical protein